MTWIVDMFTYPFMQRAFVAGVILALLLSVLGIFVLLRRLAFFGDGVAHSSLAGIAIGLLVGFTPLPFALLWAIGMALGIHTLQKRTKLSSDALIGILFTASMAFGVVLLSFLPGYQPELLSFLFGSILSINVSDLIAISVISAFILGWVFVNRKSLVFLSVDTEGAQLAGVKTEILDILLLISLAVSVVLGVKILGIILVSALIILPASIGRLLSHSFRGFVISSLVVSELVVLGGLVFSYVLDTPSGATIILLGSAIFFLVALLKPLFRT